MKKIISFIIPVLNEEQNLKKLLPILSSIANSEIIISDGGSIDKSLEVARGYNTKIYETTAGRGQQLNIGAANSEGELLFFLHADILVSTSAINFVKKFFEDQNKEIATFRMKFDYNHPLLKIYSFFTKFNFSFSKFGDQTIIVRRNFFLKLGGFENYKLFEDVVFLNKAREITKLHILPFDVVVSSRKFVKDGFIRNQLLSAYLLFLFHVGVRTETLYNKYYKNMKNKSAVIIFVKYPVVGKVKTRLAKSIGFQSATTFYSLCVKNLVDNLNKLQSEDTDIFVFFTNSDSESTIKKWIDKKFIYLPQSSGNLGTRMSIAFNKIFANGYSKGIIIGSDIPDVSVETINKSLLELDNNDVVLGPSYDGGYYLLGMKSLHPELFEGIKWSSELVYETTVKKITDNDLQLHCLPYLRDIDTISDLNEWIEGSGGNQKLKNILKENLIGEKRN